MFNSTPPTGVPANSPAKSLEGSIPTGAAARIIGVTTETIREYIRNGYIKAYRVGPRNYRIPRTEMDRILAEAGTL